MRCPRCGAENAEQAEWCYLCQYRFSGEWEASTVAPESEAGAVPPPAASAPEFAVPPQAFPPPPAPAMHAPPPGAQAPGLRPAPPRKNIPTNIIALVLVVALAVIAAGLLTFFLLRGKTYTIKVPTPPGYAKAGEDMMEEARKSLEGSEKGITLDEAFIDESNVNFIFVIHQDVPFSGAPSGKDPEEMERYFYEHKDEWTEAFNSGLFEAGSDLNPELERYEVIRLACGDAALHMTTSLGIQQYSFLVDTLWIIKESSAFAIVVEGMDPQGDKVVEFLRQNVTFE